MHPVSYFHVDAFTDRSFGGAPATVFVADTSVETDIAKRLSTEYGQQVCVFLEPDEGAFSARIFASDQELGFVGHASLAAAYVLLRMVRPELSETEFRSPVGGTLRAVQANKDAVTIELNVIAGARVADIPGVRHALPGLQIVEMLQAEFGPVIILSDEQEVRDAAPDMERVKKIEGSALILTAPSASADFVSRVFAPKLGLNEDPVCGTAHRIMVPYWAERLQKTNLFGDQVSWRGGKLLCEQKGDRILLTGNCVCLVRGNVEANIVQS